MTNNVEEKPKRKIPLWVFIGIGLIFLCFCMIVFGFGLSRLLKSFDGELPFGLGDAGGPLVPGQGDSSAPTVPPLPTNTPEPTPSPTIKPQLGSTLVSPKDGMVMVYVPEGEFEMGDKGLGSAEKPVHTVYLDGFWIDQTEVTHELYKVCVEQGGCDPPSNTDFYDDPSYANHPIVYATWLNANNYCEWAGRRLPTEAEWEKAARGTDGRWYPWGNTYDCPMANFGECNPSTSPVGSYPEGASPYGALDMAGNVWEWVSDWYDVNYYHDSPHENPQGPSFGEERGLRGGSYEGTKRNARTATRGDLLPEQTINDVGFRCALSP
jgi:formylglycine-generating enzyme required for sulfatase activity